MNLAFSEKWPKGMPENMANKPTFFVAKVMFSLFKSNQISLGELQNLSRDYALKFGDVVTTNGFTDLHPKRHTIRADEKNRWQKGKNIHFIINNRTPHRYQFAPTVEVKSVQGIKIRHFDNSVCIGVQSLDQAGITTLCFYEKTDDGYKQRWNGTDMIEQIAINDGFDSVDDFFAWFKDDFEGKLIHWTDTKY